LVPVSAESSSVSAGRTRGQTIVVVASRHLKRRTRRCAVLRSDFLLGSAVCRGHLDFRDLREQDAGMSAESTPVTFRDFASAIMSGDVVRAGSVLESILGLSADAGSRAATHFQSQMASAGQPFMMKAMGLRQAVSAGTDEQVDALLQECFGLSGEAAEKARQLLRAA
jgi:hypothetical protein